MFRIGLVRSLRLLSTKPDVLKITPDSLDKLSSDILNRLSSEDRDEAKAIEELRQATVDLFSNAGEDDPQAQTNCGAMFYDGAVVEQDDDIALQWFTKAAEQKHPEALVYLGMMHWRERGVKNQQYKAEQYFKQAAELGSDEACVHLAGMYYLGEAGVPKNEAEALKWFNKAKGAVDAEAGDATLGSSSKNNVTGFIRSANMGSSEAQYLLALFYERGLNVKKDLKESVKWCTLAANNGHVKAMIMFGRKFREGLGVEANAKSAIRWMRKAANTGDVLGCLELGDMEESAGRWKIAMEWYLKAAHMGNSQAMACYADLALLAASDGPKAKVWYERALERGENVESRLGELYLELGESELGVKMLEESIAKSDDVMSLVNLGKFYRTTDPDKTEDLFRRAANKGLGIGEFWMGKLCQARGDTKAAQLWMQKALERGIPKEEIDSSSEDIPGDK